VVCHPKGAPHIIDPERLWQGTLKTLGETGRAYGPMLPVDPSWIATEPQLASAPFQLLDTPGHSAHHYAIAADGCLFHREKRVVSACHCLRVTSTCVRLPRRAFFWKPPCRASTGSMETCPEALCYGHFGMRKDGMNMLAKQTSGATAFLEKDVGRRSRRVG
jgi:hypothetical protein